MAPITIESIQELVKNKGECLELFRKEYKSGTRTCAKFRCNCGHEWESRIDVFKSGCWCKVCSYNMSTIDNLNEALADKGECIEVFKRDKRYHGKFKCKCGYEFVSLISNIKAGQWCRHCSLNIMSLAKLNNSLSQKGRCLSLFSKPGKGRYGKFECMCGHTWEARLNQIVAGSWCGVCSHSIPTLDEVSELVKGKGECLKVYIKSTDTYSLSFGTFKCSTCDSVWDASVNGLKAGKWCMQCSALKTEKLVKSIVEELFDRKFMKVRPRWLEGLELDLYNKELKVGIEVNGVQHYKFVSFFHKTEQQFQKLQENDKRKRELCGDNGIKLFIVPYQFNSRTKKALRHFITDSIYNKALQSVEPVS